MKYLPVLLSALLLLGASTASAFDVKKGQWIGYAKAKGGGEIREVMTFYVNDQKDFKGYSFTDGGHLIRFTGNVNDGGGIFVLRRARRLFDDTPGRITGRPVRFTARFKNVIFEGFRLGTELKAAGAYEGFNSFGHTVLMLVRPTGEVSMIFKSKDFQATLEGKTSGRFFNVQNEDGSLRVKVTVSGDGRTFRGDGRNGSQAFRVFGKTLPEVPEEVEKK